MEPVEITLINPETDRPYQHLDEETGQMVDDEPVILSWTDYQKALQICKENEITFQEWFLLAIESFLDNCQDNHDDNGTDDTTVRDNPE